MATMLKSFSNPYLTPDDFSVPCRLRRCEESSSCGEDSDNDTTKHEQHAEEMTCTMRKWHKENNNATFTSPLRRNASSSHTKADDAELIFSPTPQHAFHRRRCMSGEFTKDTNTPIPLSKRFASFGTPERIDPADQFPDSGSDTEPQSAPQPQFKEDLTIPVKDIIKVLTRDEVSRKKPKAARKRNNSKDCSLKEECRKPPSICISTCSGSYELLMESANEQLVVLTFLKVNSVKGKVSFVTETDDEPNNAKSDSPRTERSKTSIPVKANGESTRNNSKEETDMKEYQSLVIEPNPSTVSQGTAQSTGDRSFDVEALTSKKMAERLQTETLAEKLERRFYRLVSSLDDLSSNFTKCACGCFGDSTVDHTVVIEKETPRRRKNTDSTVASEMDKLEVDPGISTEESTALFDSEFPIAEKTREELLAGSQMPSGLSVEHEEDYLVDAVPCRMGNFMVTCDI